MSWGQCYSGSNNIHFNFPPIMNDGRNYASWQPEAVINQRIQQQENIKSSWDYRKYMQQNGLKIMKYNSHELTNTTPSSNVPYLYKSQFDTNVPSYGYCTSDLKSPYLSREQLNARMIAPTMSLDNIS
jgi:hypothetical protein